MEDLARVQAKGARLLIVSGRNYFLRTHAAGNKSGALLLTTFILKPGAARNGLPKDARLAPSRMTIQHHIGEACTVRPDKQGQSLPALHPCRLKARCFNETARNMMSCGSLNARGAARRKAGGCSWRLWRPSTSTERRPRSRSTTRRCPFSMPCETISGCVAHVSAAGLASAAPALSTLIERPRARAPLPFRR